MPEQRSITITQLLAIGLASIVVAGCQTSSPTPFFPANVRYESAPYVANITDTSSQQPVPTGRIIQSFDEDQTMVTLRTAEPGGRLNGVERQGPYHYRLFIEPENNPINDSAWYGFEVVIDPAPAIEQSVTLELDYTHGSHRYTPKIRAIGGARFTEVDKLHTLVCEDRDGQSHITRVELEVEVHGPGLQVFAQPPATSRDVQSWVEQTAEADFVRQSIIGRSVLGTAIHELRIGRPGNNSSILIIGRQHPPEVTGWQALRYFTERLCEDDALTRSFRDQFETIVVPMVNPDGVDNGHWRSNHHGVDLNRDWWGFHQPETQHVRDRYRELAGKIAFAIDFHSTHFDIFYTNQTVAMALSKGTANTDLELIRRIALAHPEMIFRVQPVGTGPFASVWFGKTLKAPAITYEVGDTTTPELLRAKARTTAEELMRLLLDPSHTPPGSYQ